VIDPLDVAKIQIETTTTWIIRWDLIRLTATGVVLAVHSTLA
jgi:hypothetical protein